MSAIAQLDQKKDRSMDAVQFLALPIDIRKLVYFHLNGQFCNVGPETTRELYFSDVFVLPAKEYTPNERQRRLRKRLYKVFENYLGLFDYEPALIDTWLEYSLWLRYDCIVLDCLRLNHLFEGNLIGPVDLIYLDGRVRLAYFDKNFMLWSCYTFSEYARWIEDENDQTEITYLRLNLEYLRFAQVDKILKNLRRDYLLDFVSQIRFEQEDNDEYMESQEDSDEDFETASYRVRDPATIRVIQSIETMRGLRRLSVRGTYLYECLVNFHGVRDNPGNTINYIVKKRITCIELLQAGSVCRTGVADFTRWENLRELKLIRVGEVDLNKTLLPHNCRLVTILGASQLRWWDVVDKVEEVVGDRFDIKNINKTCTMKSINKSLMDAEEVMQCQTIVKACFRPINYMKLHDIYSLVGDKLVVPGALFYNKRILLGKHVAKEIIVV